jgi:hypothetical protein
MSTWPASVEIPRQVTFQSLLERVYAQLRIDKRMGPSDPAVMDFIVNAVNEAHRYAWNKVAWPESKIYKAWAVRNHPETGTPFIPRTYLLEQVATCYGMWTAHPLADPCNATPVPHQQGPDGWYLPAGYTLSSAWVHYRPDPWEFTAEVYDATATYGAGDLAWFRKKPGDGHVYAFIGAAPLASTPPLNTDGTVNGNWQQRPVLYVLTSMLQAGAGAIYNRGEEKFSTAEVLAGAMDSLIEDECLRLNQQDGLRNSYRR